MHRSLFVLGLVLFWSFPALAQPRLELPEDVIGLEGRTKNIVVVLDTDELLIDGYSFDVCHDDEIISIDEENILRGSAIEELDFDTHIVTTEDGAWWVAAILAQGNSVGEDQSIDLELYVVTYALDAIGETDLTFCGDIEMANAVVDGEDTEFVLDEGNLEVREEGPSFRRGDVDGDGVVHPLVDGLRLLYWGITTTPAPPCMEAADVDANGSTSAIPDGLRLLSWGAGSANAPPDPGSEICGPNPVGDQEGCEAEDTCSGGVLRIVDPEDASFTLSLSEASGDVDDVVTITISLVGNEELLAFQFGVCHDDAVSLDVDAIAFEEPDDDDFIFEL